MHGSIHRFRAAAKRLMEAPTTAALGPPQASLGGNGMRISARNRLKGRIVEVTKGATTAHVRIDVGGAVVTASITNQAVDELGLTAGDEAYAIVKASDVMVGKD